MTNRNTFQSVLAVAALAAPRQVPREQGLQQQQGSLQANAQGDAALASVDADLAGSPAFNFNRGFSATITDTGTGDLTLTLSQEQNLSTQGLVQVTPIGTAPAMVTATPVSTTGVRVRTWSATVAAGSTVAAADIDYWIRVTPITAS